MKTEAPSPFWWRGGLFCCPARPDPVLSLPKEPVEGALNPVCPEPVEGDCPEVLEGVTAGQVVKCVYALLDLYLTLRRRFLLHRTHRSSRKALGPAYGWGSTRLHTSTEAGYSDVLRRVLYAHGGTRNGAPDQGMVACEEGGSVQRRLGSVAGVGRISIKREVSSIPFALSLSKGSFGANLVLPDRVLPPP